MSDTNKKPLCYAPWITTYDISNGDIAPCCEFKTNAISDRSNGFIRPSKSMSMEERFNHPTMEEFKHRLMTKDNLNQVPECINCSHNNDTNVRSLSTEFDEHIEKFTNDKNNPYVFNVDEFKMIYMDYRESNVCNFSCRMCGPSLSSTHLQLQKPIFGSKGLGEFGEKANKKGIVKNIHDVQEYLDCIDDARIVQFLGGEPTLTDSMFIIIKELRKRKMFDTCIGIVTNGSLLHRHEDDLLTLLEDFTNVNFSISVDCIGPQHNYWRHNNTWHQVEKNIDRLLEWRDKKRLGQRHIDLRVAIGWQNSFAARDVFDRYDGVVTQVKFNQIHDMGFNLNCIRQEHLDKLIIHWKDYPQVQSVFKSVVPKSSPKAFDDIASARHIQDRYDKINNTTLSDVFPEWEEYYNEISKFMSIKGLTNR
jgi:pyruvate-formate lyase-activating enzyme